LYDGTALAKRGVIVVTFNYRLGLLGSFIHPALAGEKEASGGNWGLADQMAALRWIAINIEHFGGDKDRVTVFGQSAGAGSILAMLAAPSARGLFSAAILSSPVFAALELDPAIKRREAVQVVGAIGLASPDAASMRAISAERWVSATSMVSGLTMGPFTDGKLLKESPRAALLAGRVHDVPLLVGSNIADGGVLSEFGVAITSLPLPSRAADEALSLPDLSMRMTAAFFTAPAHFVAAQTASGAPSYLYQLVRAGAPHGYDVPFVFDNLDRLRGGNLQITSADRQFAAMLAECWVSFARIHRPACGGMPVWPPLADGRAMNINDRSETQPAPDENLIALARELELTENSP
jgi:para-nitrobenzyl esterase